MSLFKKLFKREVGGTLVKQTRPTLIPNRNIVLVNSPEMAMKVSAVYRCVDLISSGVAMLPFEKKRLNRAYGYFMTDTDDRMNYLITVKPNRHQTAYELKKNAVIQMLLYGNAYIIPVKNSGVVQQLVLCTPHSVAHDTIADIYTVNDMVNGIRGTYSADEIIHLRGTSLDGGRTGVSVITYASTILGIQASADAESLNLFARGGRVKGMVTNPKSTKGFGEYQDKELQALARKLQQEIDSGSDIMILPGQTEFTQISMSSVDMQLLEQKKFGVEAIAHYFGVPLDKLLQQTQNYKASEMSQVNFLNDTLRPVLCKLENEFNAKLISEAYYKDYRFEFDTTPIYTTDLNTEADYMTKTIAAGTMTVNEWRRKKNLKPVDGGDVTLVSCNVAPIDSAKISGETNPETQNTK